MPNGNQYIWVYGTKGAVDLLQTATIYPLDRDGHPSVLAEKQQELQGLLGQPLVGH